nr:hypothetical protein [Paenibacillus terrae]
MRRSRTAALEMCDGQLFFDAGDDSDGREHLNVQCGYPYILQAGIGHVPCIFPGVLKIQDRCLATSF